MNFYTRQKKQENQSNIHKPSPTHDPDEEYTQENEIPTITNKGSEDMSFAEPSTSAETRGDKTNSPSEESTSVPNRPKRTVRRPNRYGHNICEHMTTTKDEENVLATWHEQLIYTSDIEPSACEGKSKSEVDHHRVATQNK